MEERTEIIETVIDVRNIQAIEKFQATIEMPGAIIEGSNGKGKTTLLSILAYAVGVAIDFDATKGTTDGDFTVRIKTKDGNQWIIGYQVDAKGKEKHYLIQPNLPKVEGKALVRSTLKSIWNYKWQTFQDFLPLTKTAEGKRKITAMLIEAMPEEVQEIYVNNVATSNPKNGTDYTKRTEKNRVLDTTQAVYDAIEVNKDDLINDVTTKYENFDKTYNLRQEQQQSIVDNFEECNMLWLSLMNAVTVYDNKLIEIERKNKKKEEIDNLTKEILKLDTDIKQAREDNKTILKDYCPIPGIEFTEDDILVDSMTIDKMANSERFIMYCKIMEKSNKLPIILLDEVDGLDDEKIANTIKLAKDNNALLVMTRKMNQSPLQVQQLTIDMQ